MKNQFAFIFILLLLSSAGASTDLPCGDIAEKTTMAAEEISQRVSRGTFALVEARPLGEVLTAYGKLNKWEIVMKNRRTEKEILYHVMLVHPTCAMQSLKRITFEPRP